MKLDAVIISDFETDTFSGSNPLRLSIQNKTADLQVVLECLRKKDQLSIPSAERNVTTWASAPKLNGIFLFSYLSSNNLEVKLINNYYKERETFRKYLDDKPNAVIISTTFISSRQDLFKIVDDIRSLAPDVFIIAGGTFVYSSYLASRKRAETNYNIARLREDFLFMGNDDPAIDLYIIHPQGPDILCEALHQLRRDGKCSHDLPSSGRMVDGSYLFGKPSPVQSINRHVIDWRSLPPSIFDSGVVPMQASTGCTSHCSFCNFVKEGRGNYIKPIGLLESELEAVVHRGARYVWFLDDHFRLGQGINDFCKLLLQKNLNLKWMSFVRADALAKVDFDLLRRAGCKELQLGLESADKNILENMNKKVSASLYAEVIKNLLSVGIDCSCYFIFGFPGETEKTIHTTIDFINNIQPSRYEGNMSWSFYPFILAPLSPIFEDSMRQKYGLKGYMHDWVHDTMDAKTARGFIKQAFLKIDDSGGVYRGDDLDAMEKLSTLRRKQFLVNRHRLAKLSMSQLLTTDQILDAFRPILGDYGGVK